MNQLKLNLKNRKEKKNMAVETNKDQWVKQFGQAIGEGGNPNPISENNGNMPTDKHEALEYVSYKDMLSSKIQASNAKDQALKYAQNSLANAGFAGQGMAESTRAGIMNNYNRAIMGADEQHQQNLMDIAAQKTEEQAAAGEDKWQSVMTMMQQATSQEDLDYLKSEFYPSMTDDQKKMFDYYYSSFSNSFVEPGNVVGSEYNYNDNKAYAYDKDGGSVSTKGKFNKENETMNSAIATGKIEKDTYIQLHNLSNQDLYLYYGRDGKLYYVSKDTYNNAQNKVHIYGKKSGVNQGAYVPD